jgi:hypothetical protein
MRTHNGTMAIPILASLDQVKAFVEDVRKKRAKKDRKLGGALAVIYDATPQIAAFLLESAVANRKVRPAHVRNLACTIRERDFHPLIASIKLDADGQLIDGQHRLLAIQASGVPATLHLAVIANDDAMGSIDLDALKRSEQDSMRLQGKDPIPKVIIGGLALERNDFVAAKADNTRIRVDNAESSPFLALCYDLYKKDGKVTTGTIAAAVRCARVDRTASSRFFLAALDRENTKAEIDGAHVPAIVALREKLQLHSARGDAGFPRQKNDALRSIVAFEAWYRGNETTGRAPINGAFPSLGRHEWHQQIDHELVAGRRDEDITARVNGAIQLYNDQRATRR